jgi:uncharacterized protein (DUF2141 family)
VRHRSRAFALALTVPALAGAAGPAATAPQTSDVTITATDLRNGHGVVRACMTGEVAHFPSCKNPAASNKAIGDAAGSVTLTFRDVKPGRYAIALLHDENANGKADRAAMMIPTEGFGFSRDAKVRFGPPKFADAAFDVAPGGDRQLVIRMRYML